jgi:hypothetical protein
MDTQQAISATDVINRMVAEGYAYEDVQAVFDSMVDAGLEIDEQPDDGYVLTAEEVEMLYDQVGATYRLEGEVRVHGNHVGYFDADGGEWEDGVDAVLLEHGFRRVGSWKGDYAPVVTREASPALFEVASRRIAIKEANDALRQSVQDARKAGESKVAIAAAAGVSRPTLDAWLAWIGR